MKKLVVIALIAAFAAFAWFSLPPPPRPEKEQSGNASQAGGPVALSDGVVVSLDRTANNVTISHGPLRNLGMPPMTMQFQVRDAGLLENVKVGDKVKFQADLTGGVFSVMKIAREPQ